MPQLRWRSNLAKAARYGIKPGDVRRAASVLIASEEVGDICRDGKTYDVHVWSTPKTRNSIDARPRAADRHAERQRVRLGDVADVRI